MEIKISRSSRRCCASDREFVHEDEIVSLVRYVDGALVREDYAREHWDEAKAKGAYSTWNTRFYDPQVAQQEPEEKYSPLRQIFYEATGSESREELATAFLAAQLLRRQKVFRQVRESEETEEGGKLILYVDRIGNKLIEVRDPNFTFAELESARFRLMDRLMALEAPPGETEAAAEAELPNAPMELEAAGEESAQEDGEDDIGGGEVEEETDGALATVGSAKHIEASQADE
jgi:hypothetical protein